ncbi:MAG: hypothetical protein PUB96_08755 [Helicobacteraceae bacterium]|nr:hypothetical protein [Helicobacteraceae bacterium]
MSAFLDFLILLNSHYLYAFILGFICGVSVTKIIYYKSNTYHKNFTRYYQCKDNPKLPHCPEVMVDITYSTDFKKPYFLSCFYKDLDGTCKIDGKPCELEPKMKPSLMARIAKSLF